MTSRERQIRLLVEYDGSGFCGWQAQPRGRARRPSVQETLEAAVREVTGEEVRLVGAGRTDAGVSAEGQVACFPTTSTVPPDRFAFALNSKLPPEVVVLASDEPPPGFHPRRSAKMKLYRYTILNRLMRPAIDRTRLVHVPVPEGGRPLDAGKMREGAKALVGTHDFTSFAAREATREKNAVRTIRRLDVRRETLTPEGGQRVVIEVEGPGFLMHMVRTIAGSLIEVGRGKEEPGWIERVLEARDRSAAGPTAPAEGLTLVRVRYDV